MKAKIIVTIVFLFLCIISNAQNSINVKPKTDIVYAGGVSIKIPQPDSSFVELGDENRGLMEIFVPEINRLIAAYVLKADLPHLFKEDDNSIMGKYALVEVPRRGEYMDCEPNNFQEAVEGVKEVFGDVSALMKGGEEEFNKRMKSLDLDDMQVKIGEPTQLGVFFSKQDIFGLGMIIGYDMSGTLTKMGAVITILRVKKRLLFVYLYAEYKNEDTLKWLRRTGEKWSDEILANNKL
jgi:hypothetical protein